MAKRVKIKDIVPSVWDSNDYAKISTEQPAVIKIDAAPVFIEPELKEIRPLSNGPFIIISAPGAVGKTTFAKFWAHNKKSYYWDLSKLKLGSNAFLGTLGECFGYDKLPDIIADLRKGDVTFFFDAFDEAEIISGFDGINNFIKDIYRYCCTSKRPNVILFSRSETAGYIELALDYLIKTPDQLAVYEIDYFDHVNAIEFIKRHLSLNKDESHQKFKQSFEKAVDNIFATIGKGIDSDEKNIWENEEIRSFIGYSPVLQTIGSYIQGQNFEEVANKFAEKNTITKGIEVIALFINELLLREQNKFVEGLKQRLTKVPKEWNQWDSLYTPEEQTKSIALCFAGDNKYHHPEDHSIPAWMTNEYLESAASFHSNHPFIRNNFYSSPAFRDYSMSKLLNDERYESHCNKILASGSFILTTLFIHFYAELNNHKCKGPHAGYLYESASSKNSFDNNSLHTFIKPNSDTYYALEVFHPENTEATTLTFECFINEKNPLVFNRRLQNADIDIKWDVVIGKNDGTIELSNVQIICRKFILNAKECLFKGSDTDIISIEAEGYVQHSHSIKITVEGQPQIQINWPGGKIYPWAQFYTDLDKAASAAYKEELYSLRRILEPFRKHGKNEFAKQSSFIENKMVGHVTVRKQMLEYLISSGILTKNPAESKYYLDDTVLQTRGINWADLKSLSVNLGITNYLRTFREKYPKESGA